MFNTILIESGDGVGPFGAKGVGEPSVCSVAPAIANAVYDAIGVRIYDLAADTREDRKGNQREEKRA